MVSNRWFRKHQKKIFGALVVILMITWSMGTAIRNILESKAQQGGGVIFGEKFEPERVRRVAYHLTVWAPQRYAADQRQALADAWEHLIYLHEAERLGLVVTQAEVRRWLTMWFQIRFRREFGTAQYQKLLSDARITPAEFEATVRELALVDKLQSMQAQSVKVSREEAWQWYRYQNEKVRARYASIGAEALAPHIEVTEAALRTFHEKWMPLFPADAPYGHGYRVPEQVKVEYLLADAEKYRNQVVVTDREIKTYYENNKWQFRAAQGAEGESPVKPLEAVRDEIERTLRRRAAQEMAEAQIARVDEAVAERMETEFGSTDVKRVDFKALQKEFPSVRYGKTDFFDQENLPPELSGAEALAEDAFGAGMSGLHLPSRPIACDEGMLIFQTTDLKPEHASDFADVRDRVEKDYRLARARELAREILAKAAEGAEDFEAAVAAAKERVKELGGGEADADAVVTTGQSRFMARPTTQGDTVHAYDTGLGGDLPLFARKAFELESNEMGVVLEDQDQGVAYLLTPAERQLADRAGFQAAGDGATAQALQRKREAVMQAMVEDIRRRANPSQEVRELLGWEGLAGAEN